jgi:predicted amidohydrolase YtcJ
VGAFALLPTLRTVPELVLYRANVITIDERQARARAVAIAGGRFLAVGDDEEVRSLAGPMTVQVDLEGRTVVPGFIDAHAHPASAGRFHLRRVDCDLRSIAAIRDAIAERARRTPAGEWVLGFKYDDTKTEEGRPLTRQDLDTAAPGHPVYVAHRGGHTGYASSLAFTRAGVSEQTPDPQGGRFDRDPDTGRLTGKVRETASDAIEAFIPSTFTRDDYREGVALISRMMARAGITSVHDAYGTPEDLRAYQDAHAAGSLATRVYCLIGWSAIDRMIAAGVRTGLGDEWVRVGAMKMTCDGSISERTARLSQPYVGSRDDHGILVTQEDELYERGRKAHEADWQIGVHANGDVAIDITLRVFERLQRERPRRDPRFRIEQGATRLAANAT